MDFYKLSQYIDSQKNNFLDELGTILRIQSISADPAKKPELHRCAETISEMMRAVGIENVRLFETDDNPLVYGDYIHAAGKPTVLVYGHYDVQPVDPLSEWESPPFEPAIRNDDLYARGSTDDKGQLFIHLKAFETYIKLFGNPPVNLKFVFEGEEEIGSIHLDSFVKSHNDLLKTEIVLISDTAMYGRDIPSICYGLRGMVYFEVTVENSSLDLHSAEP